MRRIILALLLLVACFAIHACVGTESGNPGLTASGDGDSPGSGGFVGDGDSPGDGDSGDGDIGDGDNAGDGDGDSGDGDGDGGHPDAGSLDAGV